MVYFEKAGPDNTRQTLTLAFEKGRRLGLDELVLASTTGRTAKLAHEIFQDFNIVVVGHHCGTRTAFQSDMPPGVKAGLEAQGMTVISATHALSGVERAVGRKHGGVYPALLVADTLRLFGQGVKVAVEVCLMAADAGALSGKDVIAIGGSSHGADAALVLKPAHTNAMFDLRVREVICKPRFF